jgi:SNF2 family DNA or RNA helicase
MTTTAIINNYNHHLLLIARLRNIRSNHAGYQLKAHQQEAITHLLHIWQHGTKTTGATGTAKGALLADDMGLGKCCTTIVAARLARMQRVLVICPKSAIKDWLRELNEWHPAPGIIRTPPAKDYFTFGIGWLIINYEQLRRYATRLRREHWDLIVLDEAHFTKELVRRRSMLVFGGQWKGDFYPPLPSLKRLVVTGTPLKNRLEEIQQLLAWLDWDTWRNRDQFINRYYAPFDAYGGDRIVTPDSKVLQSCPTRDLDDLHTRLTTSILVRTPKSDIDGLPPRRQELKEIAVEGEEEREWFAAQARRALILNKELRQAYREKTRRIIKQLEKEKTELQSVVYQQTTRVKRQPILDYLLFLPKHHKVVVIGTHRSLLLDQLAKALRKATRGLVEHNGDTSDKVKSTVRQFQSEGAILHWATLNVSFIAHFDRIASCGVRGDTDNICRFCSSL